MVSARGVGKWAAYTVGAVLLLLIVGYAAAGTYLSTPAGKAMIARQIAQRIDMPVEVEKVHLGLRSSSIGLKVFDPSAPRSSEVFAVDSANADVSLLDLIRGRVAPSDVELRGLNLTLRVSADGKVLTTLPTMHGEKTGPTPAITLVDGHLTIHQDGRPEFSLHGLNARVEPVGDEVRLSGTVEDPSWGKWKVSGHANSSAKTGSVELHTDDGPLTMDLLESVPFVPPAVWQHVRADGRGAVTIKIGSGAGEDMHYSVDIRPKAAAITLPDTDATLQKVTGLIHVSGTRVRLEQARTELAGGTLAVDGEADFGPEPTTVTLDVAGDKLNLQQLPAGWGLPRDIQGQLKGRARMGLKIHSDGQIETSGGGNGTIEGATINGIPASIAIHLGSKGNRYRFETPKAGSKEKSAAPARPVGLPAEWLVLFVNCQPPTPPPGPDDRPTTLDATVRFRDVDIEELLKKTDVKLGYSIKGKVSAELTMAVPLTKVASQAAYEFHGSVTSKAITFEGLTVHDLSARATYQDGQLTLSELTGKIDQPDEPGAAPGVFRGTASVMRDPPGPVTADLTFNRIPLGQVLRAIPDFDVSMTGAVAGKGSVRTTYDKLEDPTAWRASAELTASELVVEQRHIKDVSVKLGAAEGVASLTHARATVEGIDVTGEGRVTLSGKYPYTATVRTGAADVTDLRKLVPEIKLPAPVEGVLDTESHVTGTASPFTFAATGHVKASKLTLGRALANQLALDWKLTTGRITISNLKADVFGGNITGSADVPFAANKSGDFDLGFKNVDAAAATDFVPDFPVRIAGKVSGKVGGTIAPAKPGQSRVGNLDVDLTAPRLTVQGIPAERLVGKGTIRAGALEYSLEGRTLGGSFEAKGRYPGRKRPNPVQVPPANEQGSLRLTGLDLARIASDAGIRSLAPLRGRVDATFTFENDLSAGSGRVIVRDLQWGDALASPELVGSLVLHDGLVELTDIGGRLAGGLLHARGRMQIARPERNYFSFYLDGADARQLFAPIKSLANVLEGRTTLVLRGHLGREMRGSGLLALARGTLSGVPISGLRIPFEWATAPGGYGHFTVREATALAGSGRVRANVAVDWGYEARVKGLIRFTEVPIRTVVPSLGESAFLGNGRITGRFELGGQRVRSVDDLDGLLIATLNQTSVREIPILSQTVRFLNPSGLVKPLDAGDLRATLSRGVFRVERLALASPQAQLFADGTVTTSRRVDLNVVAHTGSIGPDVRGLRVLGLRVPLVGALPITLIRDVTAFLSNRTVRLSITGTVDNPVVRVNVGALLTEEAVRFFLARYVVPANTAAALGLSPAFSSMQRR